jgi:hypothetical protein
MEDLENWVNVTEEVPNDCNDCKVKFEDGTTGFAYYGAGGGTSWCKGIGMPLDKKVIAWVSTGNCDSIKHYNTDWK